MAAAVAFSTARPARAGNYLDAVEQQTLLSSWGNIPDGTSRYGWIHYGEANPQRPPAKGTPPAEGWYKRASEGTIRFWEDTNGNGTPDEGEVRTVPYWLYFRTTVAERQIRTDWHRFNPESALREAMVAQPAARRVAGLLADEPVVLFGRRCYAAGPCLELWVDTDVYLVFDLGHPVGFGLFGGSWLYANRQDREYTTAKFTQPEAVDTAIRALYAGPCGKASADAALAMLSAWKRIVTPRVADGPGFKGFYPPDPKPWYPTPAEVPGDWIFRATDGGWGRGFVLRPVGSGPAASFEFRVYTELYEAADEPVQRARKDFADSTRGFEPLALEGADEAAQKPQSTTITWYWRKGNVVGRVDGYPASNTLTPAKPAALARRLAEVVLAKMRGGVVPAPPSPAAPRHTITTTVDADPSSWLGSGGLISVQVLDRDGDPVAGEPVLILPANPELGRAERTDLFTDERGELRVWYKYVATGKNKLMVETSAGHTTLEVSAGGFLFAVEPVAGARDGAIGIRVRAVEPKAFQPMKSLPVHCWVDEKLLPGNRGMRVVSGPKDTLTNEAGEASFTYVPPPRLESVDSGPIVVHASVDAVGCPYHFSGASGPVQVPLAPAEADPKAP